MAEEQRVKGILAYPIRTTTNYFVKAILLFARKIIRLQNRVQVHLNAKIQPGKKPFKISRTHKIALKGYCVYIMHIRKRKLVKFQYVFTPCFLLTEFAEFCFLPCFTICRTVKLLRMVNWSTTRATEIIKKINGLLTVPLFHFKGGRKLVKKLPFGPATLELSIAVGKLIVALKLGTGEVLKNFASVTASLMFNRYGEEAALATNDYMEASGHVLHILWNAIQILDPISLPLDGVPEFHDLYEETGIEHIKDVIDEEIGINLPDPIEEINNIAAWEAVAINLKKEKASA